VKRGVIFVIVINNSVIVDILFYAVLACRLAKAMKNPPWVVL
jgi:hypothetical protein